MEETMAVEKKQRRTLGEVMDDHPRAVFLTRAFLWFTCAAILPFIFICYRFQLFQKVSKIQIGGWGIFAILIVAITIFVLLKYIRAALNAGYSYWGQILNGFCKVIIPLCAFYAVLWGIKNSLELFLQALGCVILCETMAIFVNPFPKWVWERQKNVRVEERKEGIDYFMDEFFKRQKSGDK